MNNTFDAIVIGIGHGGVEASLALSRLGCATLAVSISLDNAGYLACNPSIGGTAKGHLVREIDALGGQMGIAADKTLIQLRMLNSSKGFAVQSLRAQVDKHKYHTYIKSVLENQPRLQLRQAEVVSIEVDEGGGYTVKTKTLEYHAKAVVVCCGVYLKSRIIRGECVENQGPSSFMRAEYLSQSLERLGIKLRRFKTGTPARIKRDSIDLSCLEVQEGEHSYSFSSLSKRVSYNKSKCFLGYTNSVTHKIIRDNFSKTAKGLGILEGTGARYCPSIEDKVERFDKERHPFFLEPEGLDTQEMYVQGLSTSLPSDVQLDLYRSLSGFSEAQIMRDAYAIEYDCIDPTTLNNTLMHKDYKGLFFAGQINGTSGYEEAAAQGLIAGINAAHFILRKPPFIVSREQAYIGVMIDDLITKGCDEPYRMMTSRSEFRLTLRQDNADLRLTGMGIEIGLVDKKRASLLSKKLKDIGRIEGLLGVTVSIDEISKHIECTDGLTSMTLEHLIKRHDVPLECINKLEVLKGVGEDAIREMYIRLRYAGYLARESKMRNEQARLERMVIPEDLDYDTIHGIRIEARERLSRLRPYSVGQAARISGVNPSDISVLLIRLKERASK